MQSWKEAAVVTGRDFHLSLGEALISWKHRALLKDLLRQAAIDKLLQETARRAKVALSVEELQAGADAYRCTHGLHSAEQTENCLRQCGLSVDDLEAAVERELIVARLMARVPADAIEAYFSEENAQFARVHLGQLTVASEAAAHELLMQLTEEGADFAALARAHSLDPAARSTGGDLGVLQRRILSPTVAAAVFATEPEQVVGPLTTDRGVHLFRVVEFLPPELDAATVGTIRRHLFHYWLRQEILTRQLAFPLLDEL